MKYLILILIVLFTKFTFSMEKIISWKFSNPKTNEVVSLGEKGSIQEALMTQDTCPILTMA